MNRKVIISRYNEPIEWVKQIKCDYIIFNKGELITDPEIPSEKIINLENWGREAQTFLKYISENWDNLAEETVFLQGNPFDHFPETLNYINSDKTYHELVGLGPSTSCDLKGYPSYPNLQIDSILSSMLPKFTDNEIPFTAGAQWIVNKRFITNKPIDWWKSLYELFTYYWFSDIPSFYGKKPGEFIAHVMERLWFVIYSYSK